MTKWQFSKIYLNQTLQKLNNTLHNNELNQEELEDIKDTIFFLENALKENYWPLQQENTENLSLETLKDKVLKKMEKDYKLFGEHFITWVSEDCGNIFKLPTLRKINIYTSIDDTIEQSLKIYSQYSNLFYKKAKFIYDYRTSLIQETNHRIHSSYCFYSNHLRTPFFIIVKKDGPHVLIHEIQHGIENILNFPTHYYYQEVGPIVFEMLMLDQLSKQKNSMIYFYKDRIKEANFQIDMFCEYFSILLKFAKKDFKVSTKEFISLFVEHYYTESNFNLNEFIQGIQEDILDPINNNYLCYFLSFLKSIEIREKIYNDKKDGMKNLYNCLLQNKICFNFSNENIKCYRSFCKEIKEKQKILIKK